MQRKILDIKRHICEIYQTIFIHSFLREMGGLAKFLRRPKMKNLVLITSLLIAAGCAPVGDNPPDAREAAVVTTAEPVVTLENLMNGLRDGSVEVADLDDAQLCQVEVAQKKAVADSVAKEAQLDKAHKDLVSAEKPDQAAIEAAKKALDAQVETTKNEQILADKVSAQVKARVDAGKVAGCSDKGEVVPVPVKEETPAAGGTSTTPSTDNQTSVSCGCESGTADCSCGDSCACDPSKKK